jgi:AbrB family looped-hinge helix DNA binding protein
MNARAKITSKGQVTIPKSARDALGLRAGDELLFRVERSRAVLAGEGPLPLADLALAECAYVLESFYEVGRARVAELMRAAIGLASIETVGASVLMRALAVYELDRLDFAEAYLVAQAEATGIGELVWVDRSIDRVASVTRRDREPPSSLGLASLPAPAPAPAPAPGRRATRGPGHGDPV